MAVGDLIAADALAWYTGAYRSADAERSRARYAEESTRQRFGDRPEREYRVFFQRARESMQAANRLNQGGMQYVIPESAVPQLYWYQRTIGVRGESKWIVEALITLTITGADGTSTDTQIRRTVEVPPGSSRGEIEDALNALATVPDAMRGSFSERYDFGDAMVDVTNFEFFSVTRMIPPE